MPKRWLVNWMACCVRGYHVYMGQQQFGKCWCVVASNAGFTFRILSRSFGEKSEVKPGRIWHVIQWHRDVTPYLHHTSSTA